MDDWVSAFEKHPVHRSLADFQARVDTAIGSEKQTPSSPGRLARLTYVAKFIETRLKTVEPSLTPRPQLNSLNQSLGKATGDLKNFESDGNDAHLKSANDQLDLGLANIGMIPLAAVPDEVSALGAAASSFREGIMTILTDAEERQKELSTRNEQLKEKATQIEGELGRLQEQVESQKGRLDQAIAEFQNQFSQAEASRRQAFDTEVKAAKAQNRSN